MNKLHMIHVVDDDEAVRTSFAFALQAIGYETFTYSDASDFLVRGRGSSGVLISDVRMPGMDGIELTRQLRQEGSIIPIILVTGHADDAIQTEGTRAGANLVLGKPVALPMLIAEIGLMTAACA